MRDELKSRGMSDARIDKLLAAFNDLFPNEFEKFSSKELNWTLQEMDEFFAMLNDFMENIENMELFLETQAKFEAYIEKYRPSGWTNYDFEDISAAMTQLFYIDG